MVWTLVLPICFPWFGCLSEEFTDIRTEAVLVQSACVRKTSSWHQVSSLEFNRKADFFLVQLLSPKSQCLFSDPPSRLSGMGSLLHWRQRKFEIQRHKQAQARRNR